MSWAPEMSTPRSAAFFRIACSSPSRVRSQTPRRSTTSAARSTRSSVPSGSTTRRRSERARSSSSCSNIIGVTRSERATDSRPRSSPVSTCRSNRPSAVSSLRGVAEFNRLCSEKSSAAVGKLLPATDTTGVPGASFEASVRMSWLGRSFRVSSTPAIGGVPEVCAASAPMTRSERSPGVTTRQPGVRAFRKFGSMAPPKTKSRASRASPASSPRSTSPPSARVIWATVGAESDLSSGST